MASGHKRCAITGAGAGIGKALARAFAAAGYEVLILDRDNDNGIALAEELTQTGKVASFYAVDLSDRAQILQLVEFLAADKPLDVLIHNAGISWVGHFGNDNSNSLVDPAHQATATGAAWDALLTVNLEAPMLLTGRLLAADRLRGSVVFISSLSVFVGYPGAAVYAASKAGLASYARSLRAAYPRDRLHVLTVYPGPTRTVHAERYSPKGGNSSHSQRSDRRMPPERLARLIARALHHRQTTLIPGWSNRFLALLGWLFPRLADWAMKKAIYDKIPHPPRAHP